MGAGSLGREIARQLVKDNLVVCFDNSEQSLSKLQLEAPGVHLVSGDVTKYSDVEDAVLNVEFVIHTVAKKFVNYIEDNPQSAIDTNIDGTMNIIKACLKSNCVEKMVNISTDKVCYATSTYGLTKAITERLMVWATEKSKRSKVFTTIRLPNFPSDGSCFTIWQEQVRKKQPITITDKRMTRWFIPTQKAAELTLKVVKIAKGGEVFVPAVAKETSIMDLAREYGNDFKFIGKRPGERLREVLMTSDEAKKAKKVCNNLLWRFIP